MLKSGRIGLWCAIVGVALAAQGCRDDGQDRLTLLGEGGCRTADGGEGTPSLRVARLEASALSKRPRAPPSNTTPTTEFARSIVSQSPNSSTSKASPATPCGDGPLAGSRNRKMAEQIDHRLIYEILKSVQGRLALLERMCGEMQNMRALLRTRGTRPDAAVLEDRLARWRDAGAPRAPSGGRTVVTVRS